MNVLALRLRALTISPQVYDTLPLPPTQTSFLCSGVSLSQPESASKDLLTGLMNAELKLNLQIGP